MTISHLIYLHLPEKAIKVHKSEDSNNLPFFVVKACSLRQKYQYNSYVYFVEEWSYTVRTCTQFQKVDENDKVSALSELHNKVNGI